MELLIAMLVVMAAAIMIGILGRVGQVHLKEEQRVDALQAHYRCNRDDAVQLLYHLRKAKMHHVLKQSGLTL